MIEFPEDNKEALREIAERLSPHKTNILDNWVDLQCNAWEPPGLTRKALRHIFAEMLDSILRCLGMRDIEQCMAELGDAGNRLADKQYPFEALIVSIHFLEESYLPILINPPSPRTQSWFIALDEFLHAALASIATSYFEAYRKELLDQAEVGRVVQESLLADIPKRAADLDIAHVYISARERAQLGGDFLDFFTLDGNSAAFVIGDLSGHGLEAVADSVMLRSLFRGFMRENPDLTDAMSRINRVLAAELKPGQFATALALHYYPSGKVELVSAGHPYPILGDTECRLVAANGMVLAVDEQASYSSTECELKPGGVLVAYTDGVIEARKGRGEQFGETRALEAVMEAQNASARSIVEHLVDKSLRHAGGKFADDVAVLVIKRRKKA